ncbi:sensor domain-containing diguanylate cyclase [Robbsia sp. KACC 23696]|uniref:sensor domain-containing diguanylate cyclase n=1 Tax=Robbsia sp. KACC 23696 TaxID=3149231 RepID=UPI00325B427B
MTRRAAPVIIRAILLISLSCIALIGFDSWRSWSERTVQLREMNDATHNLARAMEAHAQNAVDGADVALVGMVERIEHDGMGPAALSRLNKVMLMRKRALPQLDGLFVFDAQGQWKAYTQPPSAGQVANNADRDYFIYHRDHRERDVVLGKPVISRSTEHWVIPVSRRLETSTGQFAGIALATLSLDYFKTFYDSLEIGSEGAVALVSTDGYLLMRRPYATRYLGKNIEHSELFTTYQKLAPQGTRFIRSAQDEITRLNTFRKVDNYALFVTAALSKDEILADWHKNTIVHLLSDALFVGLLSVLGWRLIRKVLEGAASEDDLVQAHAALERMNRRLEHLAMQDGLTGLANRRQFDLALESAWSGASRERREIALILCDIDYFKQYNDTYGHLGGDDCLRRIAETIKSADGRSEDIVARYGGEEIAILVPGLAEDQAFEIACRLSRAVADLRMPHEASPFGIVTMSAGVAVVSFKEKQSDRTVPASALIVSADKALYQAKAEGRNTVRTYAACKPCGKPVPPSA